MTRGRNHTKKSTHGVTDKSEAPGIDFRACTEIAKRDGALLQRKTPQLHHFHGIAPGKGLQLGRSLAMQRHIDGQARHSVREQRIPG